MPVIYSSHRATPRFGALICHNPDQRRCPETGVRIFRYELTNDTFRFPLGQMVCPESGLPGKKHSLVAEVCKSLSEFAKLSKEERLERVRDLIRKDSQNWEIGEVLAARGERLLQQNDYQSQWLAEHDYGLRSRSERCFSNQTVGKGEAKKAAPKAGYKRLNLPFFRKLFDVRPVG